MLILAVIVQTFAVIGADDDDGALVDPLRLQVIEQLADDGVGGGDLAVVGIRVAAAERLGRVVRNVRLVDVEEVEKRRGVMRIDPLLGDGFGDVAGTLIVAERGAGTSVRRVVVGIEQRSESRVRVRLRAISVFRTGCRNN